MKKNKVLVYVISFILLISFLCVIVLSIAIQPNKNTEIEQSEVQQDVLVDSDVQEDEDEIYDENENTGYEIRYYNGKEIKYYDKEIIPYPDEYGLVEYIWKDFENYVSFPDDFSIYDSINQFRGNHFCLFVDKNSSYKQYVEIEIDSNNSNVYYVKFFNNQNDAVDFYIFELEQKYIDSYSVTSKKVSYEEISSNLVAISDKPNAFLDERTYCEYLVDFYNDFAKRESNGEQEGLHWEGYGDRILDVDMMMEIQGYIEEGSDK